MAETPKPQAAAAPTKAIAPIDAVYNTLLQMGPQFEMALPQQVPTEKFLRALRTTLQLNPALLDCDRTTLYAESMKAAQDGLVLDGREAALAPFKGKAKYMPMVLGICKKARNSGEIETLDAFDVFEKDSYDSWVDEKGAHMTFRKAKTERGEYVRTVAYAITKGGGFFLEEIEKDQMDAIEKVSRAEDGPWDGAFRGEMRRKSALRRLLKYRVPSSADLDGVMLRDQPPMPKAEPAAPAEPSRPSRAGAIIDAQVEPKTDAKPEPKVEIVKKPEPTPPASADEEVPI